MEKSWNFDVWSLYEPCDYVGINISIDEILSCLDGITYGWCILTRYYHLLVYFDLVLCMAGVF